MATASLLALPSEVRLLIYHHLFSNCLLVYHADEKRHRLQLKYWRPHNQVLQVSQQIRTEALSCYNTVHLVIEPSPGRTRRGIRNLNPLGMSQTMLQAVSHLTIQQPSIPDDFPKVNPFTRLRVLVLQVRNGENAALLSQVFVRRMEMLDREPWRRKARAGDLDDLLLDKASWDLTPERSTCHDIVGTGVQVLYKDRWVIDNELGLEFGQAPEMVSHRSR